MSNNKKEVFNKNFNNLKFLFVDDKIKKLNYLTLYKSNVNEDMQFLFMNKHKKLYFENILFKNKNYLLALSKFVDYKINTCNQKFRSKDSLILIDEISKILAHDLIITNKCEIFSKYKMLISAFSIKQKENKIFKLLLSQKLIILLIQIEKELIEISNVIYVSKKTKKVKKYKKKILYNAQIYSIKNYNKNSTKLLYGRNINIKKTINNLFNELFEAEYKLKVIINYLITMYT